MEHFWPPGVVTEASALPEDLQVILRAGWLVGPAGALLLKNLYGPGWNSVWPASEVAQREREINDVYIPSYDLPVDRAEFLSRMVQRAWSFMHHAFAAACKFESSGTLTAVISVGIGEDFRLHGTTVQFFTRRGNYPDYYSDLERFREEAMAVVERSDLLL
ncbi:hypothetical protein [Actinomadura litoris]|uniref:hypothetical protein n=1 Tax=Actinomadura litoris TaxID=2678616 RepID=UPI001FA7527C|nr:hypothetical protein [Actinomadura litoris]